MKRNTLAAISAAVALIMVLFALSSCAMMGGGTTDTSNVTTSAPVALVTPADAVKSIDLEKDDPSNDEIKFTFDEEGRVSACEYKSGDVEYLASYNYRDGNVEVYLFGAEEVVDYRLYKPASGFDKSAGFIEEGGYFFKGYTELEEQKVETTAESESESSPESETETTAETTADTADTADSADTTETADTAESAK